MRGLRAFVSTILISHQSIATVLITMHQILICIVITDLLPFVITVRTAADSNNDANQNLLLLCSTS